MTQPRTVPRALSLCFVLAVSIASTASLLVAELNLKMVQSILSAIRTADVESAAEKKAPLPVQPAARSVGTPVCRERPIERCQKPALAKIIYSSRPSPSTAQPPAVTVIVEPIVVKKKTDDLCSPLAPPWKSLPWNAPPAPRVQIKIIRYQPDIRHTGTMIDYFI